MIWYLLYPLRGTTEAPVLAPNHPLRSALTRYGKYAARHALTTLLISVAVAAILIYPFPYLYTTDFTNGASNIPRHVWTDAQKLDEPAKVEPDVIMHTLWVHGSYMEALDRDVLLRTLELQNELLGPTRNFSPRQPPRSVTLVDPALDLEPADRDQFHVINGLTNQSWFFHSPLLYWSCDADTIAHDPDILATVNEKKNQLTNANVTLRHSIVFSGKRFENRRLVAADTLVVTLIHLRDSPVGRQWHRKAEALASRPSDKWDIIQEDGIRGGSQLYEFQFRPISLQDKLVLTLAYALTVIYFSLSLSRIRAVKSKFGLIVTVITQIALSILSSLTICAIFMIDLSRIPRAAYPLVILAMSLENIFRLINAVIMTSPDHNTSSRIGQAFGETGHVALASVLQNLLILWGLSKVVSPGVAAFCIFAAIAIIFDFFYLSTFFLAVLSVDVRRTELSDAFEKTSTRYNSNGSPETQTRPWTDAFFQGKIALSTRIAGTIIMVGFVLMAQWHFFENEHTVGSLSSLFHIIWKTEDGIRSPSPALRQIHQARSPNSWLRLQDHETAREVIRTIKPWANSYVARVCDPLVVVLKGSNRVPARERRFLPALYDFLRHQLTPFIVTVLVVVLAVRLLMNYLLWDELAQSKTEEDTDDEPLLSVKSLSRGHALDVAMLSASPDGHIVSVGLDRTIRVWNVRFGFASHVIASPRTMVEDLFPVLAVAIDDESEWMALLSNYRVRLWNLRDQRWGPSMAVDLYGQKPVTFLFGPSRKGGKIYSVIIVRRNGTMVELATEEGDSAEYVVCKTPLVCAVSLAEKPTSSQLHPRTSILTLSRRGCIHRVTHQNESWISEEIKLPRRDERDTQAILPLSAFASYLVVRSQGVDLIDLRTSRIIHSFQTEPIKPKSLQYLHSSRRQTQAGTSGLGSLTLVYTSLESGDCVLQTYLPDREGGTICFCDISAPTTRSCCPWTNTREVKRRISDPGMWEALPSGCIVGIRRKTEQPSSPTVTSGLRRRGVRTGSESQPKGTEDEWEVWVVSQLEGEENRETRPLKGPGEEGGLIISELGPVVRVGSGTVAVGFGNIVKVVTVGHERFESSDDRNDAQNLSLSSRRRKSAGASRHRHL
ncbi:Sterol regulatory element-binding protein cleavage-activating protein [Pleurostoma richardsiae]|uniref:Sterol regulatory element-binding protein cleavage-activating protein n=1 Tax=Pleurostoma richardsiae TaxID=41990 RepID=A0AA38RC90_9PEZI|nr:Sterol regulatory element-binding protein cleavage-activating protein [Pleurostoma richardsiae]